jgi:hypothetical protein
VSPDLVPIFRVFFWSAVVALACWLAVMALQAVPSFREAARPRPGEEVEPPAAEEPEPASGH